jgi:hypothetical protein
VWVVESIVTRRTRFASLLPIVVFLALRALSHAHPVPLPWTTGVYDAGGLDDVLQTIRTSYTSGFDVRHVVPSVLRAPTGLVTVPRASLARGAALSLVHSRAPPLA